MEKILSSYLDRLMDEISKKKTEVRNSRNTAEFLDKVRDELSTTGKNLLSMLFVELKGYVEKNNPGFIEKNKDQWQTILDRAEALTEYGLYVAPVDILKSSEALSPTYVGFGTLIATGILTKIFTKRCRVLPSVLLALAGGTLYYVFYGKSEEKQKELLVEYIDDAYDWIKTALENMYKIFQDAAV